jgi:hypothetical protein
MNPLAEMMWQQYQVPFVSLHETYDVLEICQLYESVAEALGISLNGEFDEAHQKAVSLQNQVKDVFYGVSYISTHIGAVMALPLTLYLTQFHMQPILLHLDEFYPDDRKWAKALNEKGYDPIICHMVNDNADISVLEHLCPDFSFGELLESTGQIPCAHYLQDLYGQIGFERTCLLLSRMLKAFNNMKRFETRRNGNGAL